MWYWNPSVSDMWQQKILNPAMWEYALGKRTDCGFHGALFYRQCEAFLYTHYSACDVLNETGRFCGLRGHPFSLISTSTCEGQSLLQSDNTPGELCLLIEAGAVTVRLMLWNFQPPGNSCWRRYHLYIQTDGQHFKQLVWTFYESYEAVVMKCVKISKYDRF